MSINELFKNMDLLKNMEDETTVALAPTISSVNVNEQRRQPETLRFARDKGDGFSGDVTSTEIPETTFLDVIGFDSEKRMLFTFLDARRNRDKYVRMGARSPAGALLHGPPGNGKTLLARAFANEAGMSFIAASGSEFIKIYGGSGPKGVRDLFRSARERRPCVIFIDEIDSCGSKRGTQYSDIEDQIFLTQAQERDNTLNQLLTEIDGFEPDPEIIVMAATNRLDVLDPALTRAGRFDRKIFIDRPDFSTRMLIFRHYASRLLLDSNLNISVIAEVVANATSEHNCADLALIANEAALLAADTGADSVTTEHIARAVNQVLQEDGRYEKADELRSMLAENKT